jgi:hypothetical protein
MTRRSLPTVDAWHHLADQLVTLAAEVAPNVAALAGALGVCWEHPSRPDGYPTTASGADRTTTTGGGAKPDLDADGQPLTGEAANLTLTVETDGTTVHAAGHIYKFRTNRKEEQAQKIAALSPGNRRVSVVWPGWFNAVNNGVRGAMPPYYIGAAACGMDGGIKVSQSFTNYDFQIPGLSNIELNTGTYFRKSHLDTIGGGGIDIMVQEASVTQTIKSRHDLTSDMSAVELRERSITKQADVVAKARRSSTKPYVGKYNIPNDLLQFLGKVCNIAATTLEKGGIVADINVLSIERDANVVDKINFNIKVTVFVAGNYYDITLLIVSA